MSEDHLRGPRGLFADRLNELWQAAGRPTNEAVASHAQSRANRAVGHTNKTRVTAKKISAWRTGENIPQQFSDVQYVVRALIDWARTKIPSKTSPGLLDEAQWRKWWMDARKHIPHSGTNEIVTLGNLIGDGVDPFDLEVHRAINDRNDKCAHALPPYIERQHDRRLQDVVDNVQARSGLAVLVGGSSTGKTRSCWEAVQRLSGWRLWHPVSPNRAAALRGALDRKLLAPKTVLWLNELQHYLLSTSDNEEIAAGLRELLRDPRYAPVLVLGTVRLEFWERLTRCPSIGELNTNTQVRELLLGHEIKVPDTFEAIDIARLPEAIRADERLARALKRPDKRVTQFLAGAFELVSRYETAPVASRAIIDAAIDATRFHISGDKLSKTLLKGAAPGYMSDYDWDEQSDNWLGDALTYAQRPCLGVSGPLSRIRTRTSSQDEKEGYYRLADFLEEMGHRSRRFMLPPETFWESMADHARSPRDLLGLAYELEYRGRYRNAAHLYLSAADAGDFNGFLYLADARRRCGDDASAEMLLQTAAQKGSLLAHLSLAELRCESGDSEAAKQILIKALIDDPIEVDCEDHSYVWDRLGKLAKDTGDIYLYRRWLKLANGPGDVSLIRQRAGYGGTEVNPPAIRRLLVAVANVRKSHRELERMNRERLKIAIAVKSLDEVISLYETEAHNAESDSREVGTLMMLGRIHDAHGNHDVARAIFLEIINFLDYPPYQGVVPALVELAKSFKRTGDTATAERLWRYGLELDGRVSDPWNVFDQNVH